MPWVWSWRLEAEGASHAKSPREEGTCIKSNKVAIVAGTEWLRLRYSVSLFLIIFHICILFHCVCACVCVCMCCALCIVIVAKNWECSQVICESWLTCRVSENCSRWVASIHYDIRAVSPARTLSHDEVSSLPKLLVHILLVDVATLSLVTADLCRPFTVCTELTETSGLAHGPSMFC